jgi:hypothetical protein
MMASKRAKSATESLLQIAVGIEIAIVFFGALALNGLSLYPGLLVFGGASAVLLALVVLYRVVRYPAAQIVGHVLQVALLAAFFWDFVMGLAVLVGVGFWIFGAIRGPMLDRGVAPEAR